MAGMSRGLRRGRRFIRVSETRLRGLAREIGKRFRPEKIVLFGSYAYGHPGPDSDVDMLIVTRTKRDPADLAADIACRLDPEFPLDLIVRTPQDIGRRLAERECFLTEVMTRGQVLYETRHA